MLGTDRTEAAKRVASGASADAWDALGSGECALALAVDTGNIPAGVETEAIARDALVFYVSESNPIESLSLRDLEDIFDGDETSWAALAARRRTSSSSAVRPAPAPWRRSARWWAATRLCARR